jgi:hypothetical protein
MAKVGLVFSTRLTEEGTVEVRAPDGRLICTAPNPQAGGVLLGWIRLAGWAHKQLRDRPLELYKVLEVDPVVAEAEKMVEEHTLVLDQKGNPLI